jgi:FkbM family methyltransferase
MRMAYSQNNEEEIIVGEFARLNVQSGRFLDIGAWDGKGFSNTFRLAELGWRGVCVEASPTVFPGLIKNHAGNPLITLVNAAVAPAQAQLVEWYDSGGDAISTTNPAHRDKWEKGWKVKFTPFWVYTMPMIELFDKFGFDFDFINIDVESTNHEMFRALPWTALKQTKVICVEHDGNQHMMAQLAAQHGFHALGMNGENLILTRSL